MFTKFVYIEFVNATDPEGSKYSTKYSATAGSIPKETKPCLSTVSFTCSSTNPPTCSPKKLCSKLYLNLSNPVRDSTGAWASIVILPVNVFESPDINSCAKGILTYIIPANITLLPIFTDIKLSDCADSTNTALATLFPNLPSQPLPKPPFPNHLSTASVIPKVSNTAPITFMPTFNLVIEYICCANPCQALNAATPPCEPNSAPKALTEPFKPVTIELGIAANLSAADKCTTTLSALAAFAAAVAPSAPPPIRTGNNIVITAATAFITPISVSPFSKASAELNAAVPAR